MSAAWISLLEGPGVAILLLGFLAVEAVILLMLWKLRFIGLPPFQIVAFLGAGACFAMALWSVLAHAGAVYLGVFLVAAFVFHIADLRLRWRS